MYEVPGTVLNAGDGAVNKTDKIPYIHGAYIGWGVTDNDQIRKTQNMSEVPEYYREK